MSKITIAQLKLKIREYFGKKVKKTMNTHLYFNLLV